MSQKPRLNPVTNITARKTKKRKDKTASHSVDESRKKIESIQLEVKTEAHWESLLRREGLIVVDVHSSWCGPCTSMLSILRQFKLGTNEDRLILATAASDNIGQLAPFRNQSEPCWLFIGGGKPVRVLRGSNAPKLIRTIKSELQHELDCIAGKGKRDLISIQFEASQREAAVTEAVTLIELLALEEEERRRPPAPVILKEKKEEEMDRGCISICMKEEWSEIKSIDSNEEEEEEEEELVEEEIDEIDEEAERIAERRRQMETSNLRLKEALRQWTVIAIQSYLLETGALTEIKDHLSEEFKTIQERYINLTEEDARVIFCLPEEIPDPNPLRESGTPCDAPMHEGDGRSSGSAAIDNEENLDIPPPEIASTSHSPIPPTNEKDMEGENDQEETEGDIEITEVDKSDEADENGRVSKMEGEDSEDTPPPPPTPMIPLVVPELIVGNTLILLLECMRVKPLPRGEIKENEDFCISTAEDSHGPDADDYMLERTGPEEYDIAVATQPQSLHALYGKEKFVAGVWCPRAYEDKRFVMLNYFPQFVTEMFTNPIPTTGSNRNLEDVGTQPLNGIQK